MPTYSYACTECDNKFDAVQAFTDDALTTCPQCSGRLRKLFNSVGVVFKGSGFYRTDSRDSQKSSVSGESSSSSAEKSSSSAEKASSSEGSSTAAKPSAGSPKSGSEKSGSAGSGSATPAAASN